MRVFALALVIAACGESVAPKPRTVDVREVYRDFLLELFARGPKPEVLLLRRWSSCGEESVGEAVFAPGVRAKLLVDHGWVHDEWQAFVENNKRRHDLTLWIQVGAEARYVGNRRDPIEYREVRGISYRSYDPNRSSVLMDLSAVGVNHRGNQAVLYCGVVWGPMEGYGAVYLLERVKSGWRIAEEVMVWIS